MKPLDMLRKYLFPPDTPEKQLIRDFHLTKDANIPHRYWVDDVRYIPILASDGQSLSRARDTLLSFYRNPKIKEATQYQLRRKRGSLPGPGPSQRIRKPMDLDAMMGWWEKEQEPFEELRGDT